MNGEQPLFDVGDIASFLSLKDSSTELSLIRHADAYPDEANVALGGYDAQPLSALGRHQVNALAERLQDTTFAAIYSSPIRRAWQTAMSLGEVLGVKGSQHFLLQLNDTTHLSQQCTQEREQRTNAYAEERV